METTVARPDMAQKPKTKAQQRQAKECERISNDKRKARQRQSQYPSNRIEQKFLQNMMEKKGTEVSLMVN